MFPCIFSIFHLRKTVADAASRGVDVAAVAAAVAVVVAAGAVSEYDGKPEVAMEEVDSALDSVAGLRRITEGKQSER